MGTPGACLEYPAIGFRAVTVGKIQVEQHHGGLSHDHRSQPGGEPGHTGDGHVRVGLYQAQANQVGVSRVVLDQKNMGGFVVHCSSSRGRQAHPIQKSFSSFTARTHSRKVGGLLT